MKRSFAACAAESAKRYENSRAYAGQRHRQFHAVEDRVGDGGVADPFVEHRTSVLANWISHLPKVPLPCPMRNSSGNRGPR